MCFALTFGYGKGFHAWSHFYFSPFKIVRMKPNDEKKANDAFAASQAEFRNQLKQKLQDNIGVLEYRYNHPVTALDYGASLIAAIKCSLSAPDDLHPDDMQALANVCDLAEIFITIGKIQVQLKNIA